MLGRVVEHYPEIEPEESGLLEVVDGNAMYWETIGTPGGTPAVYLHGGPGSGSTHDARRYFDPDGFRAVLFDQRGCGRSRPLASEPDVACRQTPSRTWWQTSSGCASTWASIAGLSSGSLGA